MNTQRVRAAAFLILYGAVLLFAVAWAQFAYVRERIGPHLTLFYVLLGFAALHLSLRTYLVLVKQVSGRWDDVWLAVDLLIITAAVHLTGRVRSEAALLYFWPIVTASVQRRPRTTLAIGLICAAAYAVAAWPEDRTPKHLGMLLTGSFIILLATFLATMYALTEMGRVAELTRLREQVALAEYRTRLSQEMHDGIQHYLVNIATRLELANHLLDSDPLRAARMAVAQRLIVRQAADELRYLVRRLRSPVVEQRGFIQALKDHLALFSERSSLSAPLEIEGEPVPLSPDVEQAAFRIVQEALTNAEKHAQATDVRVRLRFGPDGMECAIADNGVGFDPAEAPEERDTDGGFGLSSMAGRAESVGARLQLESAPGQGTKVTFFVPLRGDDCDPTPHR